MAQISLSLKGHCLPVLSKHAFPGQLFTNSSLQFFVFNLKFLAHRHDAGFEHFPLALPLALHAFELLQLCQRLVSLPGFLG